MSEPADSNRLWEESVHGLGERSHYKRVWNRQAEDPEVAKLAVSGFTSEESLELTGRETISFLQSTVGIRSLDIILEIGCGVARVGKLLSEQCYHWIGTDISGEMLKHAAARLAGRSNVTLLELHTVGLGEICTETIDLVYCTVVFMHLLEWDRFKYVTEMFRVLRPGGRCYFDNVPLDTEHGWRVFSESAAYPLDRRRAHMSMTSSREEFRTYLEKAGFEDIRIHELSNGMIAGTGRKPAGRP
jgi:ubiquinone/menaquinone biosynthesis C-methylase UbiE